MLLEFILDVGAGVWLRENLLAAEPLNYTVYLLSLAIHDVSLAINSMRVRIWRIVIYYHHPFIIYLYQDPKE